MDIKQVPAHPSNYTATSYTKDSFVLHWSVTYNIEGIDQTFTTPNTKASTHYGIGENKNGVVEIHQYVQDPYYAYANGNTEFNRRAISIEHVGGTMGSNGIRRKPSQATHEMSIQFIAQKCKDLGIKELRRGINIFKHNEVSNKATECCGTLDIDYITNQVNLILKGETMDTPSLTYEALESENARALNDNKLKIFSNTDKENMDNAVDNTMLLDILVRFLKSDGVLDIIQKEVMMRTNPESLAKALQPYIKCTSSVVDTDKIVAEVKEEIIADLND